MVTFYFLSCFVDYVLKPRREISLVKKMLVVLVLCPIVVISL